MEHSPFAVRGVIEGFYGSFYTFPERDDLIRFLGAHGFNFYMYGPKNDRQHRMRWWDPYPPAVLDEFGRSIRTAHEVGVTFAYAISFGVPMNYASREDFEVVTGKFRAFYDRGCRSFGVLLDDLTDGFVHEENRRAFRNVAHAHSDCSNRIHAWLKSLDPSYSLYVCPTEYHGTAPFGEYLREMGEDLDPEIDVFYTGPDICSTTITVDDVAGFVDTVRRPPLIWDNYPANDLQMRAEMHVGPLRGRDPLLFTEARGFVANLMNQAEASKIALLTIMEYVQNPEEYDPERAWERALKELAGEESYQALRHVAENSLGSVLESEQAPEMNRLVTAAIAALDRGEPATTSTAVRELSEYLDTLDEATYHLKNRMGNLALRQNLLPWIEALDEKLWMGRGALRTLCALDRGEEHLSPLRFMEGLWAETRRNPRSIGGTSLSRLVQHTRKRVKQAHARTGGTDITRTASVPPDFAAA